jgi:catechol 2,3-dioxygenase-like lactoylglutathione lyase family enzyme
VAVLNLAVERERMRTAHIGLHVDDLKRSLAFFTAVGHRGRPPGAPPCGEESEPMRRSAERPADLMTFARSRVSHG